MKIITILFILTSHSMVGDTGKKTGVWLEELATPYYALVDAGYKVDIISIDGGDVPIDPASRKNVGDIKDNDRFLNDKKAMAKIINTKSVDTIKDTSKYAAVFLPGGHGTMWDFPKSKRLAEIVSTTLEDGRIVAAVCHGPAGLVNAKFLDGTSVVKNRKVSAFTNSEEKIFDVDGKPVVPFLLETRLVELGAKIQKAENFKPMAVADENLITGQNPASSKKVVDLIIKSLKNKKS